MILSAQISRLDGLMLCASIDEDHNAAALEKVKGQARQVLRKLGRNSEPQASIEAQEHTVQSVYPGAVLSIVLAARSPPLTPSPPSYLIESDLVFLCITPRSYPRRLAFTFLPDLSREFLSTYGQSKSPSPWDPALRPYAFMEFDTFIARARQAFADPRASQNLDRLNDELRDVTRVMTKNIEDLLYRGDSLERMGELSSRLRDDSKKYRRSAERINWELLLKQYAPFGVVGMILLFFVWWVFF
jgi:vesicle transport protein SEC22